MMIVLLIAGVAAVLTGAAAILYGIPIKEFGFGNTMILIGSVAICTGMILVGLAMVVGELKNLGRRLGARAPAESRARGSQEVALPASGEDGLLFQRDQPPALPDFGSLEATAAPPVSPPWDENGARARQDGRQDKPQDKRQDKRQDALQDVLPEPEPAPKPRRNLMFASSSRKERERAQARGTDPTDMDSRASESRDLDFRPGAQAGPLAAENEALPAMFDDAWPRPERARAGEAAPQRRASRAPPSFAEAEAGVSAAIERAPPPSDQGVTVLKSGVVDGMAYSLYSDGSIEAQMPEGMMRFESIDDLRIHLDQRS
jgi:hypothetical protein